VNFGLKIPAAVGVPPKPPVDASILIPGGRPVPDQVKPAPVPPLAANRIGA